MHQINIDKNWVQIRTVNPKKNEDAYRIFQGYFEVEVTMIEKLLSEKSKESIVKKTESSLS